MIRAVRDRMEWRQPVLPPVGNDQRVLSPTILDELWWPSYLLSQTIFPGQLLKSTTNMPLVPWLSARALQGALVLLMGRQSLWSADPPTVATFFNRHGEYSWNAQVVCHINKLNIFLFLGDTSTVKNELNELRRDQVLGFWQGTKNHFVSCLFVFLKVGA